MPFDLHCINASSGYNNYILGRRMSRKNRSDIVDISGKVFGQFTVISNLGPGKYRGSQWLCDCSCGKICVVYGGHLRAGMRKSCGCLSESKIDDTGIRRLISNYKTKAYSKNREFSLTVEEAATLFKSNCFYCGSSPSQILKRLKSKKVQTIYNGIDRINPDLGYNPKNCVSACRYCNQAKSDMSLDKFKSHIERVCKWLSIGS